MKLLSSSRFNFLLFRQRWNIRINRLKRLGIWISFFFAIVCLVALVLYVGIDHSASSRRSLMHVLHICQVVFCANIIYNLIFLPRATLRENRLLKWIMDIIMLLTLVPFLYPHYSPPSLNFIAKILYYRWFLLGTLGVYSLLDVSFGLLRMIGKRTNPTLLLAGSFLFFISLGSVLLSLPKCTFEGGISVLDAVFVSTSAVCITGLTTVDVASTFTPAGILMLSFLIQVGALGVLTFTSFFALFFSGNNSIYSQIMVRDLVYSKTADSLLPTLFYVFLFTITIEVVGAVAIYFTLPPDFPIIRPDLKVLFCFFQSLSAFCNAGFTWLPDGMANPVLMHSNQWIYVVMTLLVIAGGLGFPILVNFKNIMAKKIRRCYMKMFHPSRVGHRESHVIDLNTKVVLLTTFVITVVSLILFMLLEWNNTLAGMTVWEKTVQSFFNVYVPRSSGFATVDPASFMPLTLMMMIVLMWIGGSSQSTAGGIKVNTFAAMCLNLKSVIENRRRVTVFKRTISIGSVRRANAVVGLSILALMIYTAALISLEPDLPVRALLFEAASALFTVGSSLGITASLSVWSKLVLCTAMFLGRIGLITLLMGLYARHNNELIEYPTDNIIIS